MTMALKFVVSCPVWGNKRKETSFARVVRLSGINVSVDNDDYPLQIKVASLPMPVCRYIFWRTRTFSSASSSFMMRRKNGLMIMDWERSFSVRAPWKPSKNSAAPDIIHVAAGWPVSFLFISKRSIRRSPCSPTVKWSLPLARTHLRRNWRRLYQDRQYPCIH